MTHMPISFPAVPETWPEPQPLIAEVERVPYPIDALPETIRCAVVEVQTFVKAPVPLVASSAVSTVSLACQAQIDVKRAEKLEGPSGIFSLAIADSGERKSTCDVLFLAPIRKYESDQAEAGKPLKKVYSATLGAWDAKRAGIMEKIKFLAKDSKPTADLEAALIDHEKCKPAAPRIPRLSYADVTPEALAFALARDWPSGGVISAEAGTVFGSHGMSPDSAMRNLGLLNQLWDGTTVSIDRRTSESFVVSGARLTVALQVQEPTVREFLKRTGNLARGTGFLARFLISYPESTQGSRPFTEAPEHWTHLEAFKEQIASILNRKAPLREDGTLSPQVLRFNSEAKACWIEFYNHIESELASGRELYDVRDVASKTADNAARLAGLFQFFEHPESESIDLEALEGGSRIAAWHLNEARRFCGELAMPPALVAARRLDHWLIAYCRRGRLGQVSTRDTQRLGPIRIKEKLESALADLSDLDRVRVTQEGRQKLIRLNPKLLVPALCA
jgi:putative DNA primase/helicase